MGYCISAFFFRGWPVIFFFDAVWSRNVFKRGVNFKKNCIKSFENFVVIFFEGIGV